MNQGTCMNVVKDQILIRNAKYLFLLMVLRTGVSPREQRPDLNNSILYHKDHTRQFLVGEYSTYCVLHSSLM
jgi:hypothetical protein